MEDRLPLLVPPPSSFSSATNTVSSHTPQASRPSRHARFADPDAAAAAAPPPLSSSSSSRLTYGSAEYEDDDDDIDGYEGTRHREDAREAFVSPSAAAAAGVGRAASVEGADAQWLKDLKALPNPAVAKRVYRYFQEKGFRPFVLNQILHLSSVGFVIAFTSFLLLWVDWESLNQCEDAACFAGARKLRPSLFRNMGAWRWMVLLIELGFVGYWCRRLYRLVVNFDRARTLRRYFEFGLGIPDSELPTVPWEEVVHRVVTNAATLGVLREHNEIDIINHIMLHENFLVALVNRGLITLTLPLPALSSRPLLTRTVEESLLDMVKTLLTPEYCDLHPDTAESRLKRYLMLNSLKYLLAAPFILVYLLVSALFRYAEEYKTALKNVTARRWSPFALWKFRQFNELPHQFDRRIRKSFEFADKYLEQFPSRMVESLASFGVFIVGGFTTVILAIGLINEPMLFGLEVLNRPLAWYGLLFAGWLAMLRRTADNPTFVPDPVTQLAGVCVHTGYVPEVYRKRPASVEARAEFQSLYRPLVENFAFELLSVVLTPPLLFFSVSRSARSIVDFMQVTRHGHGVIGRCCVFGLFDFTKHGGVQFGGVEARNKSTLDNVVDGKMERSFATFLAAYPRWRPNEDTYHGTAAAELVHMRDHMWAEKSMHGPSTLDQSFSAMGHLNLSHAGPATLDMAMAQLQGHSELAPSVLRMRNNMSHAATGSARVPSSAVPPLPTDTAAAGAHSPVGYQPPQLQNFRVGGGAADRPDDQLHALGTRLSAVSDVEAPVSPGADWLGSSRPGQPLNVADSMTASAIQEEMNWQLQLRVEGLRYGR